MKLIDLCARQIESVGRVGCARLIEVPGDHARAFPASHSLSKVIEKAMYNQLS